MRYITEQLQVSSKEAVLNVVEYLSEKPKLISKLLELAFSDKGAISWRICWVFRHLAELHPEILNPYKKDLFKNLQNLKNDSCKANILKAIFILDFDFEEYSELFDYSINYLTSTQKSAVKYYAIDIALKFAKKYPELSPELAETLQIAIQSFETQSLIRKAKKTIKELSKIN